MLLLFGSCVNFQINILNKVTISSRDISLCNLSVEYRTSEHRCYDVNLFFKHLNNMSYTDKFYYLQPVCKIIVYYASVQVFICYYLF
jgi:hypothetical protein